MPTSSQALKQLRVFDTEEYRNGFMQTSAHETLADLDVIQLVNSTVWQPAVSTVRSNPHLHMPTDEMGTSHRAGFPVSDGVCPDDWDTSPRHDELPLGTEAPTPGNEPTACTPHTGVPPARPSTPYVHIIPYTPTHVLPTTQSPAQLLPTPGPPDFPLTPMVPVPPTRNMKVKDILETTFDLKKLYPHQHLNLISELDSQPQTPRGKPRRITHSVDLREATSCCPDEEQHQNTPRSVDEAEDTADESCYDNVLTECPAPPRHSICHTNVAPPTLIPPPRLPGFHNNTNGRLPGFHSNSNGWPLRAKETLETHKASTYDVVADGLGGQGDVCTGSWGVLTYNQTLGRHAWALYDSYHPSHAHNREGLKGGFKKTSQKKDKHALPSGLWVSPQEKFQRQRDLEQERRQRSSGSIMELSLKLGKGVSLSNLLGVYGEAINTVPACPFAPYVGYHGRETHVPPHLATRRPDAPHDFLGGDEDLWACNSRGMYTSNDHHGLGDTTPLSGFVGVDGGFPNSLDDVDMPVNCRSVLHEREHIDIGCFFQDESREEGSMGEGEDGGNPEGDFVGILSPRQKNKKRLGGIRFIDPAEKEARDVADIKIKQKSPAIHVELYQEPEEDCDNDEGATSDHSPPAEVKHGSHTSLLNLSPKLAGGLADKHVVADVGGGALTSRSVDNSDEQSQDGGVDVSELMRRIDDRYINLPSLRFNSTKNEAHTGVVNDHSSLSPEHRTAVLSDFDKMREKYCKLTNVNTNIVDSNEDRNHLHVPNSKSKSLSHEEQQNLWHTEDCETNNQVKNGVNLSEIYGGNLSSNSAHSHFSRGDYSNYSRSDEELTISYSRPNSTGNSLSMYSEIIVPPPFKKDFMRLASPSSDGRSITPDRLPPIEAFSGTSLLKRFGPGVMRMRKDLPPPDPDLLCFQCAIPGCGHEDVLNALKDAFPEVKVIRLQYDPVYLQDYRDPIKGLRFKSMWLFRLGSDDDPNSLLLRSFRLFGQRMNIRRADDVYAEEHRAFLLCLDMFCSGLDPKKCHSSEFSEGMLSARNVYRASERSVRGTGRPRRKQTINKPKLPFKPIPVRKPRPPSINLVTSSGNMHRLSFR